MTTKRAAMRWFEARIGELVDTKQIRPDGMVWEPGPREVGRDGSWFVLDESKVRLSTNHVVLEAGDRLQVEWLDDDGVTIHWTIYTDAVHPDDDL